MEDPMIWFLLFVGLFAILMGLFQIPIWIMYVVLAVVLIFFLLRNPLLLGKDSEKMIAYLNKSKAPYFNSFIIFFMVTYRRLNKRWGKSAFQKIQTKLRIDALKGAETIRKSKRASCANGWT